MKRFHVNLTVKDIDKSVAFYSTLFAAQPTRRESDYAKWMLDDPFINFSISTHGDTAGIDHIGLEAGDEDELSIIRDRLVQAETPIFDQDATTCCYAKSKKAWISDPDGVAWETFFTSGTSTDYGEDADDVMAALETSKSAAQSCC